MPNATATKPKMSDDAVKAKTGKVWDEWFKLLDKAGAKKLSHQEIVALLSSKHGVGPWWRQMVTVTYEQARGLRDKHQKVDGYQISVSRTISVATNQAYRAFANEAVRTEWLPVSGLVVRTTAPNRSLRITWKDKKTSLEIMFVAKAADKTQVVIQHSKLPDAKNAAKMKEYWRKALDQLVTFLN